MKTSKNTSKIEELKKPKEVETIKEKMVVDDDVFTEKEYYNMKLEDAFG